MIVMSRKVNATYTADQVKNAFKTFEANSPPGTVQAVPIPTTMNRAPEEIISNFDKNSDIRPISKELAQVSFVLLSYFMSIFL